MIPLHSLAQLSVNEGTTPTSIWPSGGVYTDVSRGPPDLVKQAGTGRVEEMGSGLALQHATGGH